MFSESIFQLIQIFQNYCSRIVNTLLDTVNALINAYAHSFIAEQAVIRAPVECRNYFFDFSSDISELNKRNFFKRPKVKLFIFILGFLQPPFPLFFFIFLVCLAHCNSLTNQFFCQKELRVALLSFVICDFLPKKTGSSQIIVIEVLSEGNYGTEDQVFDMISNIYERNFAHFKDVLIITQYLIQKICIDRLFLLRALLFKVGFSVGCEVGFNSKQKWVDVILIDWDGSSNWATFSSNLWKGCRHI